MQAVFKLNGMFNYPFLFHPHIAFFFCLLKTESKKFRYCTTEWMSISLTLPPSKRAYNYHVLVLVVVIK